MCGITCAVALRGHGPLAKGRGGVGRLSKILEESLNTIEHRGPDANGHWISEDCRVGMYD
jgi:asparagine synthase (glutamine-hydrolysing)